MYFLNNWTLNVIRKIKIRRNKLSIYLYIDDKENLKMLYDWFYKNNIDHVIVHKLTKFDIKVIRENFIDNPFLKRYKSKIYEVIYFYFDDFRDYGKVISLLDFIKEQGKVRRILLSLMENPSKRDSLFKDEDFKKNFNITKANKYRIKFVVLFFFISLKHDDYFLLENNLNGFYNLYKKLANYDNYDDYIYNELMVKKFNHINNLKLFLLNIPNSLYLVNTLRLYFLLKHF